MVYWLPARFYSSIEFNLDPRLFILCLSRKSLASTTREVKQKEPGIEVELNFDSPDIRQNTAYLHVRLEFTRLNNHLKIKRMYRRLHASMECFLYGYQLSINFLHFFPRLNEITRQSKSKELFHLKPRRDSLQVRKLW